jgi:hypothetical protein
MDFDMKQIIQNASAVILAATLASPVLAQGSYNYHYSSGGARVVNQNNVGLVDPSGTYIGGGTLSQTARGLQVGGAQANPLLPKVPWGANIQTPGDNFYGANRVEKNNGSGIKKVKWGANVQTPGDAMRSDLPGSNPEGNLYIPGQVLQQKSSGLKYNSYKTQSGTSTGGPKLHQYIPGQSGVASYGDDSANGSGSTTNSRY